MWQAIEFRLFQKSAVKSQSAPAGVLWFRFFKACVYCMFMNNEILVMFVGFVRVLRPLTCREFPTFPRFRCQIVHKSLWSILYVHSCSAGHISEPWICTSICSQIIILHGIVGDNLLCVANTSLKAQFLNHCFVNRYRAPRALRFLNDREWPRVSLADIISSKDISFAVTNVMFAKLMLVSAYLSV